MSDFKTIEAMTAISDQLAHQQEQIADYEAKNATLIAKLAAAEAVIKFARELYSASGVLRHEIDTATEDDHFRFIGASDDMHDALEEFDAQQKP